MIIFKLNSIDLTLGIRSVSVKHSEELYSEEQKRRVTYFQDWINIDCMFHVNDSFFYIDEESAKRWNLIKSKETNGEDKVEDIHIPGMEAKATLPKYLMKIYNPAKRDFDEIECIPFNNLYNLLKINILIPAKK